MGLKTTDPIPGSQQEYQDQTCQQCNGTGKIFFRPNSKNVPFFDCDMCEGTGKHKLNLLWWVWGEMIKDWRFRNKITLRECSRKYQIDASNISKMERGIIKPHPMLVKLACGRKKI
ncbi:MAG TPA: hypothetical protein PKN99_03125 [Cyclobacteriaceae bacterium]|nr:hypothetical protein [Cyclobacteriaceae bacterium]